MPSDITKPAATNDPASSSVSVSSSASLDRLAPPKPASRQPSFASLRSAASSQRRDGPPPRGWFARVRHSLYTNRGLLYILLAQLFASLMALTTRLLETAFPEQKFHAIQILFARQSITAVGCCAWMWWMKVPDAPLGPRGVRVLLVARGLGGFFGVFGLYYSLTYLDLSDATVITFLAPIVATFACSIIPSLREPFTRTELIAGLTSLAGVVLIARPASLFDFGRTGDDAGYDETLTPETVQRRSLFPDMGEKLRVSPHQRLLAVGIALVGVLGAASAYTTIRWIGKRAHPLISVNYFASWCTLVSAVSLLALPSVGGVVWPRSLVQWALLIGIGVSGFIMQFLLTSGLQLEKAGRGTNMVYTQMLFALFWERVVWGNTPNVLSIVGSTLIMGSVLWVGLKKKKKDAGERVAEEYALVPADEELGLVGASADEGERSESELEWSDGEDGRWSIGEDEEELVEEDVTDQAEADQTHGPKLRTD